MDQVDHPQKQRRSKRTDYVNDVDVSDDQCDNDICHNTHEEHGQYAKHRVNRGQVEVSLVVQLYPNQPAGESRTVDARYYLHRGKATTSVGPHRWLHQGWRRPARTWEIRILEPPFQVILPHNKQQNEDDAEDEEANDIYTSHTT